MLAYVDPIRAAGAKVAVGTVLPQSRIDDAYTKGFNARRLQVNAMSRAAVGTRIDAVIDFAAHPEIGPDAAAADKALYDDGLRPNGGQGQLADVYKPVVDALADGKPVPVLPFP